MGKIPHFYIEIWIKHMAKFLTDEWFAQVANLTEQAGELNLPVSFANLTVNLLVKQNQQVKELNLQGATLSQGLAEHAKTTLSLDEDLLRKLILEFDTKTAMTAVMFGKIKIQGDMMQLMALQSAKPSAEHKALYRQILAMTE